MSFIEVFQAGDFSGIPIQKIPIDPPADPNPDDPLTVLLGKLATATTLAQVRAAANAAAATITP